MKKRINIAPIGFVQNKFNAPSKKVHIRAKRSKIVLFPQYAKGLFNINKAKCLDVIFYFHKSKGYRFICETPHWGTRGVFACRSPFRPVPLA
jgi:tRNA (Thr-GGU) A37 N-methylase